MSRNRRWSGLRSLGLALLAIFGVMCRTDAAVVDLFNTLNSSNAFFGGDFNNSTWYSQEIQTTANEYVITTVLFQLGQTTQTTGNFAFSVYTDNSNEPGTEVVPNFYVGDAATVSSVSLTGSSNLNIVLSPNTNYWIVMKGLSISGTNQAFIFSPTPSGTGVFYNTKKTTDAGSSWVNGGSSVNMIGQVVAVPEPSTYALASVAATALVFSLRTGRNRKIR